VVQPEITSYADLRGKTLSVDAVATGLAPMLVAMLARGGLAPDSYRLERVGGVMQRYEALKRGEQAGALFNSPFEDQLRDAGFRILATGRDTIAHYQGHVLTARQGWAEANRSTVVGVMRGLFAALAWLYQPNHRAEAFATFRSHMPDAPDEAATVAYATLFDPELGFPRDGSINLEGVAAVIEMRAHHGRPVRPLGDAGHYCDLSFRAEALPA
jgi:ABC-type nitrate/sulfonate/bicarbonate transport system substrate-binding protein